MSLELLTDSRFVDSMKLPSRVKLVEVGPRDGLQNQALAISITDKTNLINKLSECGFTAIETGSLVSPKQVPQMSDSDKVYQQIRHHLSTDYIMLVANQKGLDRALACQANNIAVFCAATDAFSLNNINCNVNESLETIKSICQQAKAHDIAIRAYISCVLGCPYQGRVDLHRVCQLAERLHEFGCYEISLGDTIGVGTAGQVEELISMVSLQVPTKQLAVHFHDTYGQALANILIALQSGIHIVDCSVSGLGGCPYAPGATGNVASEDVLYMLNGLGIETGINLNKLLLTSEFINKILQRQTSAKVTLAMTTLRINSV